MNAILQKNHRNIYTRKLLYIVFSLFVIGLSLFTYNQSIYAEKEYSAIVVVDTTLNVRSAPAITGEIIGSLQGGEEIDVHSEAEGWAEIRYEDRQAWVSVTYIKKDTELPVKPDQEQELGNVGGEDKAQPEAVFAHVPVDELISRSYGLNGAGLQDQAKEELATDTKEVDEPSANEPSGEGSTPAADNNSVVVDSSGSSAREGNQPEQKEDTAPVMLELGYVTADALRLREEPSLKGEIITLLHYNTGLEIKGKTSDGWLEIVTADGKKGWVSEEFVERAQISLPGGGTHSPNDTSLKGKRIIIDPGHGGKDSGTIGLKHKTYEKQLTLSTSLIIATMLRNAGAEVIMSRSNDSYVELSDRVAISNKEKADVFISVHYDYGTKNSSGIISFYYSESRDKLLANTIQGHLVASTGMRDSGVRKGNFYVLRENARPSILLELGYVSNPDEEELVRTREYQEKVAIGIVNGLRAYFAK